MDTTTGISLIRGQSSNGIGLRVYGSLAKTSGSAIKRNQLRQDGPAPRAVPVGTALTWYAGASAIMMNVGDLLNHFHDPKLCNTKPTILVTRNSAPEVQGIATLKSSSNRTILFHYYSDPKLTSRKLAEQALEVRNQAHGSPSLFSRTTFSATSATAGRQRLQSWTAPTRSAWMCAPWPVVLLRSFACAKSRPRHRKPRRILRQRSPSKKEASSPTRWGRFSVPSCSQNPIERMPSFTTTHGTIPSRAPWRVARSREPPAVSPNHP